MKLSNKVEADQLKLTDTQPVIKNYSFKATASKISELENICLRYAAVKNYAFDLYGSIEGLQYIKHPFDIEKQWIDEHMASKFKLQSRHWKRALAEAISNIKSMWSNAFNK